MRSICPCLVNQKVFIGSDPIGHRCMKEATEPIRPFDNHVTILVCPEHARILCDDVWPPGVHTIEMILMGGFRPRWERPEAKA